MAEFEREIIRERTRAGQARAREMGKTLGRPAKVFRRDLVAGMRAEGISWRAIAKRLGVSLSTVFDSQTTAPPPRPKRSRGASSR